MSRTLAADSDARSDMPVADATGAPAAPLRVALVLSDGLAGRGGIGRLATYLVRQLGQTAPEIDVRVMRARLSERAVVKHLSVAPALARFAARLVAERIDVVHLNVAPRGSTWRKRLYAGVAHRLGKPVVLHLHGSGYDAFYAGLAPAAQARVAAFFRRAEAVVVLSGHWRRVVEGFGVDPARILEVPNGVPETPLAAARRSGGVAAADPLIAFLGVVGERKGVDVLLDALAELERRGLRWRAVIAGNGEVAWATARAQALGLGDRVSFPGWVGETEVADLLDRADLFTLPSRAENQPVSIIEAMARGVPVVASRISGIPDQVIDGETGLLVAPGDAAGLADALATLIAAPALRERYGLAGRARFERNFSVRACAGRFADLYRRLGSAAC